MPKAAANKEKEPMIQNQSGDLGDVRPVAALTVGVQGRLPHRLRQLVDRVVHRRPLVDREPDRVLHPAAADPVLGECASLKSAVTDRPAAHAVRFT